MPTPPPSQPPASPQATPQTGLDAFCSEQLRLLKEKNELRALRSVDLQGRFVQFHGRRLLNLAGNDYLGLSQHPKLIEAAVAAARNFGVGAGASRLVSGTTSLHTDIEERFAAFKHAEACLLMPTGYAANLAVLTALAGPGDLIVLDKLVHASLIDAARASGAEVRTFPHRQLDRADQLLSRRPQNKRFLVTDSVFSMDGDCADLPALCDLADRHDAMLLVDEAHGTGVLGSDGSGLAEAQGIAERVYHAGSGGVVVSTASKALGSLGGLITASRPVIDLLINKARPFIYSTAVPPAQAAAIGAAIDVIADEPERRRRLAELAAEVRTGLSKSGWTLPEAGPDLVTPILPLIVGNAGQALQLADDLYAAGVFAPAIRPPTVAPGSSRVRLSLRADLTDEDVAQIIEAIGAPPK